MEPSRAPLPASLRLRLRHRRLRRVVLARRRPLAAVTAALAVLVGLQALAPAAPPVRQVLTAARDLPAGTVLARGDLTWTPYPPDAVPAGVIGTATEAVGRTTTGPVRLGEPLTDVRLLGGSLLDGYPGRVAAPIRVADAGAVDLLRVGDLVDVVAADPQGGREAFVVAGRVPVVALPDSDDSTLAQGGLVVLAVPDDTARSLAAAAVSAYLSVVVTR